MSLVRWLRSSLARKISILFGSAVLLIIAVTLLFPWLQMTALNEQALLLQAKQVAAAAYQRVDLQQPNWAVATEQLANHWPVLVRQLGLPPYPPRVVRVGQTVGTRFQREAIRYLQRHAEEPYFWRIRRGGESFRYAMAVRGTEADAHPDVLRGIIEVVLPVAHSPAVWNLVVTVLAGASGAVLAILVFYVVTQRLVLTPVRTLRGVAEKVTKGDIDVRVLIRSGDEFEELSGAVNEMLAHLKAAHEEQEKTNRSLDIRLGELAETNVTLYESNRVKSEFLANVTHELRTPLVSIIGFAELLRDAWENPEADRNRLARYTENILTSGRNLLDIINDLLDLAKIEAGKFELHITDFSLRDLCRDLIDFVQPLADKRGQQLALSVPADMPSVRSDAGRIKQILYNLMSNAIKFTPRGGAVSLALECMDGRSFRLAVSDTGPGIPEDQRDAIFEKFEQLDASKTREYEGTGLGLAITKELATMLHGTVHLEDGDRQGATFVVHLPVSFDDQSLKGVATRTKIGTST
ncbi:MAG: HAMP domain-containing protein [Planctomycetes bacterium]|nr:HAMP domain-containing protein [Planctomycetota bacterium]